MSEYQYIFTVRVTHDIPPRYVVDSFLPNPMFGKTFKSRKDFKDTVNALKNFYDDADYSKMITEVSESIFPLKLRLRYNQDMIQHIMAVATEDKIERDDLENILNSMSPERLRTFLEEAKVNI